MNLQRTLKHFLVESQIPLVLNEVRLSALGPCGIQITMAPQFTARIQLLLLKAVSFFIGLVGQAARVFSDPKFNVRTTLPVTEPLLLLPAVQLAKLIQQRKVRVQRCLIQHSVGAKYKITSLKGGTKKRKIQGEIYTSCVKTDTRIFF